MRVRLILTLLILFFMSVPLVFSSDILLPDQKETVGKTIPDTKLYDYSGKSFTLREIIANKPLILSLIYTRCTTACLLIVDNLKDTVEKIGDPGEWFNVLILSFDSTDTPQMLDEFKKKWGIESKGWFVAGGEEKELRKILQAIDFHYSLDTSTGEFIHPNLLVVLTPDGKISRYIFGVSYSERDLKLHLINAKKGTSTFSIAEGLLLRCYKYNPLKGTYETDWAFIMHMIGGGAFFLSVFLFLWGKKVILVLRKAIF